MKRTIAVAAFVIAAMALGRAITDLVPTSDVVATPFVHSGTVGSTVSMDFADVKVTSVRITPLVTGSTAAQAGGRWLVVETEMTALKEPTHMARPTLIDSKDRFHLATERAEDCRIGAELATDVPWHVTFCFDVPKDALPGGRVLFARGDYGDAGDGFRRDAVADIDLGLTQSEVDKLWDGTDPINVTPDGVVGVAP